MTQPLSLAELIAEIEKYLKLNASSFDPVLRSHDLLRQCLLFLRAQREEDRKLMSGAGSGTPARPEQP